MMFRFDISLIASADDEKMAKEAHPHKFGWKLCKTRWYRKTVNGTITALLFYSLVK